MPDLRDLLDDEANRRRPDRLPDFTGIVRRARTRRRARLAGGVLAVAAASALASAGLASVPRHHAPPPETPSPAGVTVSGTLRAVGGIANATPRGLAGQVVFDGADGRRWTARAGVDGRFAVVLPAGRYQATGTSPLYNDGHGTCRAEAAVTVPPGGPAPDVDVDCVEK